MVLTDLEAEADISISQGQNYNTCPKTVFPTKSSRFHEMLAIICFEQILQNISHNCELIMEIIHLSRFSEVQGLPIHLAPM